MEKDKQDGKKTRCQTTQVQIKYRRTKSKGNLINNGRKVLGERKENLNEIQQIERKLAREKKTNLIYLKEISKEMKGILIL